MRRLGREHRCGGNSQTLSNIVGTAVSKLPSLFKLLILVRCYISGWLHLNKFAINSWYATMRVWDDEELLILHDLSWSNNLDLRYDLRLIMKTAARTQALMGATLSKVLQFYHNKLFDIFFHSVAVPKNFKSSHSALRKRSNVLIKRQL